MAAADAAPKDFDLQMNAAATFYKAGDYNQALVYLQRALALKPQDVDALTAMGNTKYDTGNFIAAATFYERALAVEPQNTDAQTDLGNTYFQRQPPDFRRAIEEYRKTLKVNPRHEKAWQNIAAAALQLGDKSTASEAIEELSKVNPNNQYLEGLRSNLASRP